MPLPIGFQVDTANAPPGVWVLNHSDAVPDKPAVKHLPFGDFDMAGVTNLVSQYKAAGLCADYDISEKTAGVVKIIFDNPIKQNSAVVFEIHKVARPGWFGDKAHWVVQLFSKEADAAALQKHGCAFGKTQMHAVSAAEIDLKYGFTSVCDFDSAAVAYP